jgi:pyrrolysine biosynthesis protein PylD
MTRLISEMIADIPTSLPDYDRLLKKQTGCSLLEIAVRAAEQTAAEQLRQLPDLSALQVTVVPVTAGQGVISGFTEAVAAIIAHLGFSVRITNLTDVAGFAEALDTGAKLIFLADDRKFMAFNAAAGKYIDNGEATGLAFATALDAAAGGLAGKKTAVLGLGPVGRAAVAGLIQLDAYPVVYDPDPLRVLAIQDRYPVQAVGSIEEALARSPFVLDATPAADIIPGEFIAAETVIACPGVPQGLTADALKKLPPHRFIHDPLQLGVAVMTMKNLS